MRNLLVTIVIPICFVDFFFVCVYVVWLIEANLLSSQFQKDFRTCQKAFLSHFSCHIAERRECEGEKNQKVIKVAFCNFSSYSRKKESFLTISKKVRDIHFSFEEQNHGARSDVCLSEGAKGLWKAMPLCRQEIPHGFNTIQLQWV